MPKIGFYKNLIFYIVTYDLAERLHLHIINSKRGHAKAAKIWIDNLEVAERGDLNIKEINLAKKLIESNRDKIIQHIKDFSKGKKHKSISLKLK